MVHDITSYSPDDKAPYHSQYKLNEKTFPIWKKFWEKLFHDKLQLTHDEVCKMTDTFMNFQSNEMANVLNHALKVQKENDRALQSGESPEAV